MSFYFYRQHDAMQCGIACMAMVCKYYGRKCSFETLSNTCTITNEGVSMQALKQLAESLGFNVLCGKASLYQIKDINSPIILHWNQNHFVVLYKVKRGKIFYIADPAKGLVKYNLEEFKKHWVSTQSGGEEKGIAMFLEPTPAFYEKKMDEEPKEERSFNMQVLCKQNIYENCRDKES
ncbi:Lactococcin-G-processing and transport ATP-binding protein LagD [uncultured Prevotella sp.]|uniref:cysteine peptidase family C39 domain-containing protein n=1 Tax=uncultured Prevotella sp. TaxID=159272 RepID=UPI001A59BF41|nr:cysteine peptidase family C39 domain-containing protein [uncultured Prevotella sp.]VTY12756.1 Lactococcin-G-processing and transport ATP-binding protein LagD [uncultured Prevotella sp.]